MNSLGSSFYAAAIAVCFLCLLILNRANTASETPRRFFGVYLVLEMCGLVFEWLMLHPTFPFKALWLGLLMNVSLLIAPCLWLLAREITEHKTPVLKNLPWPHFAVIAIGMLLTLPLIETTHAGASYYNLNHTASKNRSLLTHGTMLVCVLIFLFQVPFYLRRCLIILNRHTEHNKALFSNLGDRHLNALRLLFFVVLSGWFVSVLRTLHCVLLGVDRGWGIVFTVLDVAVTVGVLAAIMLQTASMNRSEPAAPAEPDSEDTQNAIECVEVSEGECARENDAEAEAKYARSALNDPARQRIRAKLEATMQSSRPYLDSQLTLRKLCEELKENPHYVSQVINQDLATTFYDFVNSHRIAHAKALLESEPDKTILEIAFESGFNSKSTFNTAFRHHAGETPSTYRRAVAA